MINDNPHKYTAYCGLYCLDCIPSNKRLFELLNELESLLEKIKFHIYGELKSKTNETFNDHTKFLEVLKEKEKIRVQSSVH